MLRLVNSCEFPTRVIVSHWNGTSYDVVASEVVNDKKSLDRVTMEATKDLTCCGLQPQVEVVHWRIRLSDEL